MNFFHLLVGTTQMKIVSAEPEGLLQKIHREGIITWEVEMLDPITWQFIINSGDKKRIEQLVAQNGGSCESAGTLGVYGIAKRIMKRPILMIMSGSRTGMMKEQNRFIICLWWIGAILTSI